MSDPFAELKRSLQEIFYLESTRNERYVYTEIQSLKEALDEYDPNNKQTFITLIKAIQTSLPYIEKWRIDFNTIKTSLDALAPSFNLPVLDWDSYLSKSKTTPKFQLSALNHSVDSETGLFKWLKELSGVSVSKNKITLQIEVLLQHREHLGFSEKLSAQLNKDPDFLFRLIMESEKNFTQIAHTRLILFLTDRQLAQAIIKHSPLLIKSQEDPSQQATELVNTLNEILSNGRSVSTLLRNAEARSILNTSELLQEYLKNHQEGGAALPISGKYRGM